MKESMNEKTTNAEVKLVTNKEVISNSPKSLEDLQTFAKTQAKAFTKTTGRGSGLISIVSSKNGTRFVISKTANERLGFPEKIYIGFLPQQLVIFDAEGTDLPAIKIKQEHDRVNIYNSSLVNQIISQYTLDYTGITSRSFSDGYFEDAAKPLLYVNMV